MQTIISCPDNVAHSVLIALCQDKIIREKAAGHVATLMEAGAGKPLKGEAKDSKRKAEEIEICIQCNEAFLESENSDDACTWHDGTSVASWTCQS